jgi:RHS repeat-associated protein
MKVVDPYGQVISGTTTQSIYDGLNPVQELQNGAPSANMLTGLGIDEYFQRVDSGGTHDYLSDILGSTVALTSTSGSVQTQYTYSPFGNASSSGTASSNPYKFTGRENDGIGLDYYRARYYSPTQQRFIAQDPMDFLGGINLYAYVKDSPIDLVDPSGLGGGPYHPPPGVSTSCSWDDSCSVIQAKMSLLQRMIDSHTGWDRNMPPPRGGGRHSVEIAQFWKQYANCQAIYEGKCGNRSNAECSSNLAIPSGVGPIVGVIIIGGTLVLLTGPGGMLVF